MVMPLFPASSASASSASSVGRRTRHHHSHPSIIPGRIVRLLPAWRSSSKASILMMIILAGNMMCLVYWLGFWSGSFFCGVSTMTALTEATPASLLLLRKNEEEESRMIPPISPVLPHPPQHVTGTSPASSLDNNNPSSSTATQQQPQPQPQRGATAAAAAAAAAADSSVAIRNKTVDYYYQPHELKLPTPILVMGLMKAGTTSIYGYFQCGLDPQTSKLSHYDCSSSSRSRSNNPTKIGMACGKRMRRNLTKNHKPAFDTMDDFTLYAELDAQELSGGMTLPQWDYLEPIYQQFPNATWILNLREPTQWLDSVDRWKDLRQRFVDNPFLPDLPRGVGHDDADMIQFYERQAQRIRDFVTQTHPSLTLVEVPIDSPNAGSIMEEAFGIPKTCWRNRNVNNGTAIWTAA